METQDKALREILRRLSTIETQVAALQPLNELYTGGKVASKLIGLVLAVAVSLISAIVWVKEHFSVAFK